LEKAPPRRREAVRLIRQITGEGTGTFLLRSTDDNLSYYPQEAGKKNRLQEGGQSRPAKKGKQSGFITNDRSYMDAKEEAGESAGVSGELTHE